MTTTISLTVDTCVMVENIRNVISCGLPTTLVVVIFISNDIINKVDKHTVT